MSYIGLYCTGGQTVHTPVIRKANEFGKHRLCRRTRNLEYRDCI